MDKLAKRLGKQISRVRREKKLTSEQLAYGLGISKGYLSDIENGKKIPSVKMLANFAKILNVRIRDLFELV